jgi:hypothetical protein
MKRSIHIAAVCIAAILILATQAHAQAPCPAASPTALLTLFAGDWAFDAQGSAPVGQIYVAAGRLRATLGTVGVPPQVAGKLSIVSSSSQNGAIFSREEDVGTYAVLPDCSINLSLHLSTKALQYDCYFSENFGEIRCSSTTYGTAVVLKAERAN